MCCDLLVFPLLWFKGWSWRWDWDDWSGWMTPASNRGFFWSWEENKKKKERKKNPKSFDGNKLLLIVSVCFVWRSFFFSFFFSPLIGECVHILPYISISKRNFDTDVFGGRFWIFHSSFFFFFLLSSYFIILILGSFFFSLLALLCFFDLDECKK